VIEEGTAAPAFEAETDDGRTIRSDDLRGKPVVLYFYPKDDTPGCTVEACAIRDVYADFRARGAEVFGVSSDNAESHRAFREKHSLPFSLLVDDGGGVADAFGVERGSSGAYKRQTVVIDAAGTVAKVMPNVDPQTHAAEVLAAL
jgi:peroxiredoxin Q/BCP